MRKNLVAWMNVVAGEKSPWSAQDILYASTTLAFFCIYDPRDDSWVPAADAVPQPVIDRVADLGRQRREEAAPPNYAKIIRKKVTDEFPNLPADLVEAFVTIGLYDRIIEPGTARTIPLLDTCPSTGAWARLLVATNAIHRDSKEDLPCSGTTKNGESSGPRRS